MGLLSRARLYGLYSTQRYFGGNMKQYILTKKIAKHGSQSIIVIPRMLEEELKPHTIIKLTIDVLRKPEK